MKDDLTEHERNLANRFRSALFDLEDEQADVASLLDPEHPEFSAVIALAFPPRRQRKRKPKSEVTQERIEF